MIYRVGQTYTNSRVIAAQIGRDRFARARGESVEVLEHVGGQVLSCWRWIGKTWQRELVAKGA